LSSWRVACRPGGWLVVLAGGVGDGGIGRGGIADGQFARRRGGDAVGVQDHDDAAVAQDRVAREHLDMAQDRSHRLDDDFLGVEHAVDDDAEGVGADLSDDDKGFRVVMGRAVEPQQSLQ
jgi:hypothetical protein